MNTSNGNQNNTEQIAMGSPSGMPGQCSDDDNDNGTSSPESVNEVLPADLREATLSDDVTAQLAAAGPEGVAAATAIVSSKKRKRPFSFETNPSIRTRQQNRLLKKMRQTIEEFSIRVGQQAIVLVARPGKVNNGYTVFGAKPLEDVIKNLRGMIMDDLENALAHQAPPAIEPSNLYELPPIIIDGIPTPVQKMTQTQLRSFIPLMLKFSTGRGKPGWGRESTKPTWWPQGIPWANVRMDMRSEEEKLKLPWTQALKQIVINCYKFHGREDLLPAFSEEDAKANAALTANANVTPPPVQYTHITNPDGTVRIFEFDANDPIVILPDGTTVRVQGMATTGQEDGTPVPTKEEEGKSNPTAKDENVTELITVEMEMDRILKNNFLTSMNKLFL